MHWHWRPVWHTGLLLGWCTLVLEFSLPASKDFGTDEAYMITFPAIKDLFTVSLPRG